MRSNRRLSLPADYTFTPIDQYFAVVPVEEVILAQEAVSEEGLEEEQVRQLNNSTWLMSVVNHLMPLSQSVALTDNLKQQFLLLKQQWGYTENYELVDAKETDCTLCGHQHVSVLFAIKNILNGSETTCGSHCIRQFSVINSHGLFHGQAASRQMINDDIDYAYGEHQSRRNQVRRFFFT